MNPYEYINANNQQTADLSYNPQAKALIDSLMGGVNFSTDTNRPLRTDDWGNQLYIDNTTGEATLSPFSTTYLNGQEASKVGENKYSIGVQDPTSRGLFDVNVQVDPLTNKVSNLGTIYRSHGNNTQWYAPLAMAAMVAAPYLAPELFSSMAGAEAGGTIAGDAFLPGALATTDAGVASGISADLAAQGAAGAGAGAGSSALGGTGGSSGVGLGTGTSYSADALTNPLNPFYGTAQASPTSLGLVSGGGGATMGEGSIIGSGAGLGQTVPSSVFNVANSLNMPRPSTQSKTPQQNMANYLRLPTNLNTSVAVKPLENPFLTNNQQQLANMLKV